MRSLLSLLLGIILTTSTVSATPVAIRNTSKQPVPQRYNIQLPAGSTKHPPRLALMRASLGTITMTISRIDSPNIPAWRRKGKEEFLSQISSGLNTSDGLALKSKRSGKAGKVPTLDLHFSRTTPQGDTFVWMRFLLFRRYTLVATAALPKESGKKHRAIARNFCHSLTP